MEERKGLPRGHRDRGLHRPPLGYHQVRLPLRGWEGGRRESGRRRGVQQARRDTGPNPELGKPLNQPGAVSGATYGGTTRKEKERQKP